MFLFDPMLVLAGAGTGALIGLTGVGGGAVMTPLLLLVFGVAPVSAIGTDLWFATVTKLVASNIHHRRGLIDWQIVRRLWWGSVPATVIAVICIKFVPIGKESADLLNVLVGIAVCMTALVLLFRKQLQAAGDSRSERASALDAFQKPITIAAGALLGALVTFTSVGAGAICTVLLALLYPRRLTASSLIATDVAHAIPLTLLAGAGHLLIGNVDFTLLGNLLIGSIPGVITGALISARMPQVMVRRMLSAILLITGYKLLSVSL